jgi:nucleoside-diphosphate-sugar epimerase
MKTIIFRRTGQGSSFMNRILVTGANGCIGHVLVHHLVLAGYQVTALALDHSDTDRIANVENTDILYGNICDQQRIKEIFAASNFDVVIHLAAVVHRQYAKEEEYVKVNYEATVNLFELSKAHKVKQFIFISTVAIYGEETERVVNEETLPDPQTPYAISKFKAEEYIRQNRSLLIHYTIIRPTTVYGRYDKGNINKLFNLAKRGIVPVIGNGNNLKSLVYVENLVEGILQTVLNDSAYNQSFILSDERPYSLNELLTTMRHIMGKRIIVFHLPPRMTYFLIGFFYRLYKMSAGEQVFDVSSIKKFATNNVFDISKATKLLNFKPQYILPEGLKKAYSNFNSEQAKNGKTYF